MDKQCVECGQNKPLTEFWKNRTTADGYQRRCIPCQKAMVRRTLEKQNGKTGSVEMICQHCGKTYQERPSRVQRSKYCSVECRNLDKTTLPMIPCQVCGKLVRQDKAHRRYCSTACRAIGRTTAVTLTCPVCGKTYQVHRKAAETRKACSETCASRLRTTRITLDCAWCGKSFPTKKVWADKAKYCSRQCASLAHRTLQTIHCQQCGAPFEVPECEVNRGRRFCSQTCSRLYDGPTSIEITVKKALDALGVHYLEQHEMLGFFIDFFLPERNLALEVDGTYWHQNRKAQDRGRDVALWKHYRTQTLRITDTELAKADAITLIKNLLGVS